MPAQRTTEHFKFRNRAVRQATYLGLDKVVLITIAEFAHDDGIFYHGFRAIARASGVSLDKAYNSIQRFIADGVLVLITKGKPGYSKVTSTYQFNLDNLPDHPSVYDLVKHHPQTEDDARSPDERTKTVDPPVGTPEEGARSPHERTEDNRSLDERTNGARSPGERRSFVERTEDVDFDVDLPPDGDLQTDGDGSAASPPCSAPPLNLFEGQGQNPNQNQPGVHGREVKAAAMHGGDRPSWRPAFLDDAGESNPNPNGLHMPTASAEPPKLVNNDAGTDCKYCSQPWGQPHHKTCFHVSGRLG